MRKLLLFILCCVIVLGTMAQIQRGFVRTIGRSNDGKTVIGVERLKDVSIKFGDNRGTVSVDNGVFEFEVKGGEFTLQSVSKQGYVLVSPNNLPRVYERSSDLLEIVLMDLNEQVKVQREVEKKIRRQLDKQYKKELSELRSLRKQKKITEEEWRAGMQEIYEQQEKDENLIKEMAERYSRIDFCALNEQNRLIARYIIDGRLAEVREMIHGKGSMDERIRKNKQHREANVEGRKNLEKSEQYEGKSAADIAQDCFNMAEIFLESGQADSALCYLKKRLAFDTTNAIWLIDIAELYVEEKEDYLSALEYYNKALTIYAERFGEEDSRTKFVKEAIENVKRRLKERE